MCACQQPGWLFLKCLGLFTLSSPESVTHWIHQVKGGDSLAAQKLWEEYFPRLVGLARKKIQGRPSRCTEPEDVAQEAFASFFRRAEGGRFPQLADRNDLWRLLVVITARKAIDHLAHAGRLKHGGGALHLEPSLLEEVVGHEPTPEFAAEVKEQFECLLGKLRDEQLRKIAAWKLEGYTNKEIARMLDCALVTVERRLRLIRTTWASELGQDT
jgi:RNA polymerase sigma factor (sigma-70 family)